MRLRIIIKTPKGLASGVVSRKKFFLLRSVLGIKPKYSNITTNKKEGDDTIIWEFNTKDSKEYISIIKKVSMYDIIVRGGMSKIDEILSNKRYKWVSSRLDWTKEKREEVKRLLTEMTEIRVLKQSDLKDGK